jgi:hypothetical protein
MMADPSRYAWLEALLELLYERYDTDTARALLRDERARGAALKELRPRLLAAGASADVLAGKEGDNLSMAVLALRLKFTRDEALAKVRVNIAMRGGR